MPSSDSVVVCASPFSPTRSIHTTTAPDRSTSRQSQRSERFAARPSHTLSPLSSTTKSPVAARSRSHSFPTKKYASKKSATILRAVPESTSCAARARDMPHHDAGVGSGRMSPASYSTHFAQDQSSRTRRRSNSALSLSVSPKPASIKSFSSGTNLKASIGTYKDGKVQWEDKSGRSPRSFAKWSGAPRNQKPRIQVVIPIRHTDDKPLPSLPPDDKPFGNHIMSAVGDVDVGYNVSPPTASKSNMTRNSMVSPLSSQQARPTVHFYTTMDVQVAKPTVRTSPNLSEGARHSSDDSHDDDQSSTFSDKSSVTSDEASTPPSRPKSTQINRRSGGETSSVKSPVDAGDSIRPQNTVESGKAETGHSPTTPTRRQRVYGHHPAPEEYVDFKPTCTIRPARDTANTSSAQPAIVRKTESPSPTRNSPALQPQMGAMNQVANRSALRILPPAVASPTLSEAASDLERQLTSFTDTDENPFKWDDITVRQEPPLTPQGIPRKDSVTYSLSRHSPPPLLPRKSSKRQSQAPGDDDAFRLSHVPGEHIASQLRRSKMQQSLDLALAIPEAVPSTQDDFSLSPLPLPGKSANRAITADADDVLKKILQSVDSLDDLFAGAIINRDFYRVFKQYELELMQAALRKESPPAWEHREICYPGHDDLDEEELDRPRQEYTPTSYIRYYIRDMYIIYAIKSLIKDKCDSFLRPEMSDAMSSNDALESARIDDALWRIWTFCKIFGSGKGREDDVVAQMDWLKGGVIVHEQNFSASALTWDDMNETLASAPECFAKGNEGGLSAVQLFDMMELWNCLGVLLQPIEGRTIQAREHGVFDNTDIRGGDIDGEELMLDEWYYYLMTLGLSTILDLTGPCRQADASVFLIAGQHGCLDWKPPVFGGTRRNFFKEAASRVYEDKIALTYAETSTKEVQRILSKQRIQKHISELRHRQQSGEALPYVRMSQERPMSDWEGVFKNLTRPRPPPAANNLVTHIPSLHSSGFTSALAQELSAAVSEMEGSNQPSTPSSQSPPRRTVAMPLLPSPPPSTVLSMARDRSSIATSIAQSPPRRIVAMPLLPSPPPSTVLSMARDRSSIATSAPQSPPRRIVAMPLLPSPPPSTVASTRDRSSMASNMPAIEEHPAFRRDENIPEMPRLEEHPMYGQHARQTSGDSASGESSSGQPVFQQHPLQRIVQEQDSSQNTADRAIYRIVEMGFTPEQARLALRMTDLGDGLRVDRAVELLLREGLV